MSLHIITSSVHETAEVIEVTLTDGSTVYNVRIIDGSGARYQIPAQTKGGADVIAEAINKWGV